MLDPISCIKARLRHRTQDDSSMVDHATLQERIVPCYQSDEISKSRGPLTLNKKGIPGNGEISKPESKCNMCLHCNHSQFRHFQTCPTSSQPLDPRLPPEFYLLARYSSIRAIFEAQAMVRLSIAAEKLEAHRHQPEAWE